MHQALEAVAGWLPWTKHLDLSGSRGNGPFRAGNFRGVVLHVNADENGTSDAFFAAGTAVNPNSVTPTFQVYKDGQTHQYLPLNWQPWCQRSGNEQYAAIETAGLPTEPLTAAQIHSCGLIVRAFHDQLGMKLQIADTPGEYGLGTHQMGGAAWGGHPCPGTIRTAQRADILTAAAHRPTPITDPDLLEEIMALTGAPSTYEQLLNDIAAAAGKGVMAATVPLTGKAKPARLDHLLAVWHAAGGWKGRGK